MLRLIAVALILTEHVPWHHLGRAAGVDAGSKGNQSNLRAAGGLKNAPTFFEREGGGY
jgi:hypothetical protein